MAKDMLGRELHVGDRVAHVKNSRSSVYAYDKVIKEFKGSRVYFEGSTSKSVGWGGPDRLIKLEISNG